MWIPSTVIYDELHNFVRMFHSEFAVTDGKGNWTSDRLFNLDENISTARMELITGRIMTLNTQHKLGDGPSAYYW